jgi:hypothetical protein
MRLRFILTNLDVGLLGDLEEQQRQLKFLVVGHSSPDVHLVAHDLRVDKVDIALFEFFNI